MAIFGAIIYKPAYMKILRYKQIVNGIYSILCKHNELPMLIIYKHENYKYTTTIEPFDNIEFEQFVFKTEFFRDMKYHKWGINTTEKPPSGFSVIDDNKIKRKRYSRLNFFNLVEIH